MTNEINVRGSGDGVGVVGKIVAEATMAVKFHNFPIDADLRVTAVSQDIVTATGVGGVEYKDYAFYANIKEIDATGFGYPTGTNSRPFGHEGLLNLAQIPGTGV